jgi:transposase
MARLLHELRGTLAEGGLDFAAVAEGGHCPEEAGRWQDLMKLEAAYRKLLGQHVDLHDAKRAAAERPALPKNIRRVAVMGVPDLPVVVQQALEKLLADGVPVEVMSAEPTQEPAATGRIDIRAQGGLTVSIDRAGDRTALKLALEVIGELGL